jgi:hypothetical protein
MAFYPYLVKILATVKSGEAVTRNMKYTVGDSYLA